MLNQQVYAITILWDKLTLAFHLLIAKYIMDIYRIRPILHLAFNCHMQNPIFPDLNSRYTNGNY